MIQRDDAAVSYEMERDQCNDRGREQVVESKAVGRLR